MDSLCHYIYDLGRHSGIVGRRTRVVHLFWEPFRTEPITPLRLVQQFCASHPLASPKNKADSRRFLYIIKIKANKNKNNNKRNIYIYIQWLINIRQIFIKCSKDPSAAREAAGVPQGLWRPLWPLHSAGGCCPGQGQSRRPWDEPLLSPGPSPALL